MNTVLAVWEQHPMYIDSGLNAQQKLAVAKMQAYDAGEYTFPVPPVCTANWSKIDWMLYVDRNRGWNNPALNKSVDVAISTC